MLTMRRIQADLFVGDIVLASPLCRPDVSTKTVCAIDSTTLEVSDETLACHLQMKGSSVCQTPDLLCQFGHAMSRLVADKSVKDTCFVECAVLCIGNCPQA